MDKKAQKKKADELLRDVGIPIDSNTLVKNLGVGTQQMVEIVKALSKNAKIIVFDEPTGSAKLVQHYPKEIPVILFSLSMRISEITDRHSVRFSSRVSDS